MEYKNIKSLFWPTEIASHDLPPLDIYENYTLHYIDDSLTKCAVAYILKNKEYQKCFLVWRTILII